MKRFPDPAPGRDAMQLKIGRSSSQAAWLPRINSGEALVWPMSNTDHPWTRTTESSATYLTV